MVPQKVKSSDTSTEKIENYSHTFVGRVGPFPVEQTFVVPITVQSERLCRIM